MLPIDKLIALRHRIHSQPELSGHEAHTAGLIERYLLELKPDHLIRQLGGHGLLATFDSGVVGPALLLRCELDAIQVQETNSFAYRSQTDGIAHKCGHDGHISIMCGVAELLAQQRPQRGKVHLLFQPAEENGEGARAVLLDPQFAPVQPDFAIALHNFPDLPHGAVVLRDGITTAAVSGLILRFQGRTSHASQPELGANPALAISEIVQQSHALNRPNPVNPDFRLITPVHVRLGAPAFGVSAGDGEVYLTLRSWSDAGLEALQQQILELSGQLARRDHLELSHQVLDRFHANHNDPSIANMVRQAAKDSGLQVIELEQPLKGGEDFGLFTARFPCCMFLLGTGLGVSALHSPDYDFPDSLITPGVQIFERVVRRAIG